MQFSERHNNTREQVDGYLRATLECVEAAEVPDDLREVAFTAVVNLIASKQIIAEQMPPLMTIPQNARH
jgi:hypothetical protein